jgi:hypothetical protein
MLCLYIASHKRNFLPKKAGSVHTEPAFFGFINISRGSNGLPTRVALREGR